MLPRLSINLFQELVLKFGQTRIRVRARACEGSSDTLLDALLYLIIGLIEQGVKVLAE